MNWKKGLWTALLLSFSLTAFAQTKAEIEAAKAMARSYGYSESEINAIINKAGGGANEVSTAAVVPEVSRTVTENAVASGVEATPTAAVVDQKPIEDIYGHAIFKSPNLNFVPSYNIPTPKNYVLGAGDQIVIDLWGAVYAHIDQKITPEGSITIPDVGPVYIVGNTIEEANGLLKGRLAQIYSGLAGDRPTTFMRLTLGSIRSITVNVIGDIERPGTYTVPSLATVFSAVYMAGGPTANGSVRNIALYRNNELVQTLDVYDFIQKGDFSSNVRLEENDLIKVNIYDNIISIGGQVKRPMRYELKENENLLDLLNLAGGYSATANVELAHVVRRKGDRYQNFDVAAPQFASFELLNGDQVSIPSNISDNKNRVTISGEVWHPGTYSLSDTLTTLRQLIRIAGGVKEGAYLERGYMVRYNAQREVYAQHFSLQNVLDGTEDVQLNRDDDITIFASRTFIYDTKINVYGEVNGGGAFDYKPGMTLGDAILLSGGFTVGAAQSNIDVARRNVNDGALQASKQVATIFNFNLLKDPSGKDFELKPYDMIFVRVAPDYKKQQLVTVDGQVNFPGSYVIPENEVRLSEVIAKAGGISPDAYVEGATVTRQMSAEEIRRLQVSKEFASAKLDSATEVTEGVMTGTTYRIGVDLQKALEQPGSYYDLILKTGDVISIPRLNNTVKISGGVLYQNVVTYDPSKSLNYYIGSAGGYIKGAKRNGVYIVYMNGMVATKRNGGMKIRPGCEIVVPVKDKSNKRQLSATEVVSIATSATSLATMVVSMVNMLN